MANNIKKDPFLQKVQNWKAESENLRKLYDERWKKNLELCRGIYSEEELTRSRVRKRSKIFYRKIWATTWRLTASFYNSFLRGQDTFAIEGRGGEDVHKAEVLQEMVEYRRDVMNNEQSLFTQFIWAFLNITRLGNAMGKLSWEYNPELGKDGPVFTLYPNEQVFSDMSAERKELRRYVIFVNYMTKEDMEEEGYDNIEEAEMTGVPSNPLRHARHQDSTDPLNNPRDTEYPTPGRYDDDRKDSFSGKKYEVWETFYREKGKIKFAISNAGNMWLKKPVESPYGDRYPDIQGSCLLEPHKLLSEGFPESLEGPQESLNALLNMRKDNIAMTLNRGVVVQKNAGVDLQSLVNARAGRVTMANDVNGVKWDDIPDVTGSAYIEANADEAMMSEMSGITPGKQGLGTEQKATVAQINFSESNAKIDLYTAIVGETFVRDFYSQLAYLIQKFETDEKVFRVANDSYRRKNDVLADDVFDLNIEADCIVNVGIGTVGKDIETRQTMLAMDRAIQSNQSMIQLVSTGLVPPEGIQLFNTTAFMEDILPNVGKKNIHKYFIKIPQPQQPVEGGGGGGSQPQDLGQVNDLQSGGFGGI